MELRSEKATLIKETSRPNTRWVAAALLATKLAVLGAVVGVVVVLVLGVP